MPSLPNKLISDSQRDQAFNKLVDHAKSLRPQRSYGTQTTHSPFGVLRKAVRARPTGGAKASSGSVWI